jgi:hypothetical protein
MMQQNCYPLQKIGHKVFYQNRDLNAIQE